MVPFSLRRSNQERLNSIMCNIIFYLTLIYFFLSTTIKFLIENSKWVIVESDFSYLFKKIPLSVGVFFFSTNSEARSFGIFEIFFVHVQLQFLFNSFLMKMLRLEFVEREWQMIGTNDFCRCYKRPKN